MLRDLARCGVSRDDPHMCRNLHRLIKRASRQIKISITDIRAPIRTSKRGRPLRWKYAAYPILLPSSWADSIFRSGGHFWMGGCTLQDADSFGEVLSQFWHRFKVVQPQLQFYEEQHDWHRCIPFAIHGDEGRGKGKKPVMVLSLQPLVTSHDMSVSNMSGCLVQTSFLTYVLKLQQSEDLDLLGPAQNLGIPFAPGFF